ncbi:hypothetical protein JW980_06565 [Acinetobacter johnsonii]|uniref:hypothetical protein n=1 Tax=Acinetobacter johnsonii TaxID=40214 RepID=UPI00196B4253|nr:hypothetical protein [Acinetobacter johnsonii]QSE47029.1 hypothetical protein JW980_06565 [Acinetobacter johnsonii]
MTEYDVKREHYGDKYYATGDKRTANPADVKHLVDKGVLVESAEESKPKTTKTPAKQAKSE